MKTKTRLNHEIRQRLGALLMDGMTPTEAAQKLGINRGFAVVMRKKLVTSGTLQPLRNRKTAKNKRRTVPSATVVATTPARTKALQFRINGVDFSVDNAKRVMVENGVVDIKY